MKNYILCIAAIFFSVFVQAQVSKTVAITAGGLSSALTADEKNTITSLVVTGVIDARDFKTMRDDMPALTGIDLSGSTVAAYTGANGTYGPINFVYPENTIPERALSAKNKLGSFVFPSSVIEIGNYSFTNCSKLTTLTIPETVISIGNHAFESCAGLTSITVPESVNSFNSGVFMYCSGLETVDIKGLLKTIENYTFYGCKKLSSINIPNSVATLGESAFSDCSELSLISLPNLLKSINYGAFRNCNKLSSINIPQSVNTIQSYAFYNCIGLLSIYSTNPIPLDLSSFYNVFTNVDKSNCKLYIPNGSKVFYSSANQWKDFINIQEMPEFRFLPSALTSEAIAANKSCDLITEHIWTAVADQSWLSVSPSSGTGNTTMTITCQANTSLASRIGSLSVSTIGWPTQTLAVTQYGVPVIIEVEAGGLALAFTEDEKKSISNLVITGVIDARDFKTMRDEMPSLISIDLSKSTVAAYTGTKGTGGISNIVYPINSIPEYAFYNQGSNQAKTKLVSLIFPSLVVSIGNNAFNRCSGLGSIIIPSTITSIGNSAFYNCTGITSVTILGKIKTLEYQTFSNCTKLNSVVLPTSLTSIGDYTFRTCSNLISINLPPSLISIGAYAFSDCTILPTLFIPRSVNLINGEAFGKCTGLSSITTNNPTPVQLISGNVFRNVDKTNCKLYVPFGSGVLFSLADQWKDFLNIVEMSEFNVSKNTLYLEAAESSNAIIDLTTDLEWTASSDQSWLSLSHGNGIGNTSLTFTAQLNEFHGNRTALVTISATGLPSQTIIVTQFASPKAVSVEAGGLSTALTAEEKNIITSLVVSGIIDARDFKTMRDEMPSLINIDLSRASVAAYNGNGGTAGTVYTAYPINTIPESAFFDQNSHKGKTNLVSFVFPSAITAIGNYAFENLSELNSLNFPNGLLSIGNYAFYKCSNLSSFILPSTLTSIGSGAFYYCSGLTSVTIPGLLKRIESSLFYSCTNLSSVTIPESVISIGNSAFSRCSKLTSINLPPFLEVIEYDAFSGCTMLNSILFPKKVSAIGSTSFSDCTGLSSIYVNRSIPLNLGSVFNVFSNVNKTTCKLYVPFGSKSLYSNAYQWKDFINILEMPEFRVSSNSLMIEALEGSKASIDLATDLNWTAISDQSWLTVSQGNGTGNATLIFTASVNLTYLVRTAIVKISSLDLPPHYIVVTQPFVPKSVETLAGGLSLALLPEEKGIITSLIVKGFIDARDFKTMRDEMPMLEEINLKDAVIEAYSGTDGTVNSYSVYPANTIPKFAFYNPWLNMNNPKLNNFVFPTNTITIDNSAFEKCTGLKIISMPSKIKSIERFAFSNCTALTTVNFSETLTKIGFGAFNNCRSLISLNLPASVTLISQMTFYGCSNLISINLPSGISVIENNTFLSCKSLSSIDIPSSVNSIGNTAFTNCTNLIFLNIPSSVTYVGNQAFSQCSGLISVNLSSSIDNIGEGAFSSCNQLLSIYAFRNLPLDLNNSDNVFLNVNKTSCILYVPFGSKSLYASANQWKDFLNIVEMPLFHLSSTNEQFAVEGGVHSGIELQTKLNWTAVSNSSWLTVNPSGGSGNGNLTLTAAANASLTLRTAFIEIFAEGLPIQTIAVFQSGRTKSIRISAGELATQLTFEENMTISHLNISGTIDARDFKTMRDEFPNLTDLDISETTVVAYTGSDGPAGITDIFYPNDVIPDYSFLNEVTSTAKTKLKSILFPETINSIGNYAFSQCINLSNLLLPAGVTSIGNYVFSNCRSLVSLNCPDLLTAIGNNAFQSCTELRSISLSPAMTLINRSTFSQCSKLTNINIPPVLAAINDNAFENCKNLISIVLPQTLTDIGRSAFLGCTRLNSLEIPPQIRSIKESTFGGCRGFVDIRIPFGVETIGVGAFVGCIELVSIDIPSSVTSIGQGAFSGCQKLTSIRIPESVKEIKEKTFYFCTSLSLVLMPSSLVSIGINAFSYCYGLHSITIPATVEMIGSYAFSYCDNLKSIYANGKIPVDLSASYIVFHNVDKNTCILTVPENSVTAYSSAPQWKDFMHIQANHSPVALAGADQIVNEGETVFLDGSASSDPENQMLNYYWAAPEGIFLDHPFSPKPRFTAPEVMIDTSFSLSLSVSDQINNPKTTQIIVTVKQVNKAPISESGANQTVNEGQIVTLNASGSKDPDNDGLTYSWTAPDGISISSTNTPQITFHAPEVTQDTNFAFGLIVHDGKTGSTADQVVVTVKNVNKAPISNAGTDQTVKYGTEVQLNGQASGDPDGSVLSYLWKAPVDITLNDPTLVNPVFMAPTLSDDKSYLFTLVVSDGFLSSNIDTVVVIIKSYTLSKDMADAPMFEIYPNPSKNFVNIRFAMDLSEKTTILISDRVGRQIMDRVAKTNPESFDLQQYPTGIYFITVKNKKITYTARLIRE